MLKFTKLVKPLNIQKPRKRKEKFDFSVAPPITSRVHKLLLECSLDYIDENRIFCVESVGSKSCAYARIWGLPRIWQTVLKTGPAYILEVTHKFSKINSKEQDRVLLHELAHVPKNFSGALVGHHEIEKRIRLMQQKRFKK